MRNYRLLILSIVCPFALSAQLATTQIIDTVQYGVQGTLAQCNFRISGPNVPTTAADGSSVTPSSFLYVVKNGVFNLNMVPNDQLVPSGTSYSVTRVCLPPGPAYAAETWRVPTSGTPVRIQQVKSPTPPPPTSWIIQWSLYSGNWAIGTTYGLGNVVAYQGNSYVSLQAPNAGHLPTDTAWWVPVASPTGQQADATHSGFLSSMDWVQFNSKQAALGYTPVPNTRNVITAAPLGGGGPLSGDLSLTCAVASAIVPGCLSAVDWAAFNAKQPALGFTPENVANKNMIGGYPGLTAGGLLNTAVIPPALTGMTIDGITPTLFSYLASITSDVQSQINGKLSARTINTTAPLSGGGALTGDLTLGLNMWGTGTKPVAASGMGTIGDCAVWALTGLGSQPCGGGGGGGADPLGTYFVSSATNAPANAVNLGLLSNGLLKIAISGGIATPSIATPGADFENPLSFSLPLARASNAISCPTCLVNNGAYTDPTWLTLTWAGGHITGIPTFYNQTIQSATVPQTQRLNLNFSANFTLTDSTPNNRTTVDLASSITSSTTGNAATATQLATTPAQCSANNFSTGIAAAGTANCAQPAVSTLSDGAAVVKNNQANIYSTGAQNMASATSFTPPASAGTVNGHFRFDGSALLPKMFISGSEKPFAMFSGSFADNDCLKYNLASGMIISAGSPPCGGGSGMVFPPAGVPNSSGSAWNASYTVGLGANNLVQLSGSSQLPAVSAALLTNFPTFNQNTTGTAAAWTTARLLGGNSVTGTANVPFANKFIVQGTTDAGLTGAQFLGSLATGLLKSTTVTGILSVAAPGTDYISPAGTETMTGKTVNGVTPAMFAFLDPTSSVQTQINGKQPSLGFTAENAANKDTDGSLAANSDTRYASQKAVRTYIAAHSSQVVTASAATGTSIVVTHNFGLPHGAGNCIDTQSSPANKLYGFGDEIMGAVSDTFTFATDLSVAGHLIQCAVWGTGAGSGGPRPWKCLVTIGDPAPSSPALVDANDRPVACTNDTGSDVTITTVAAWANAGSPTVTPIFTAGTATSILTGALSAGTGIWAAGTLQSTPPVLHSFSGAGATCASAPCTVDVNLTTAGGTAKYVVVKLTGFY